MKITHKFDIHLDDYQPTHEIRVMQCDANTRELQFALYTANKQAWQAPSGAKVYVSYCKPDGTGGFYDTLPDGTGACTIDSGNTISAILAEQVLTVPGKVTVAISIQLGDAVLTTFAVKLRVEKNPGIGAMKSENYFCLKAAIDAAVVAAQKPVHVVIVSRSENDDWQSDYTAQDIQYLVDHRTSVMCYWYDENISLHLADYQTNTAYSFTGIAGAKEYCVTIKYDGNIVCQKTALAKETDIPKNTSDLSNDSGFLTEAPVTAVNGQTGDVTVPTAVKVTVTKEEDGTYKAEGWTTAKILEAYNAGNAVYCQYTNWVLPLLLATKNNCSFGCVYGGNVRTVMIGLSSITVTTTPLASGEGSGSGTDGITPHIGENGNWFIGDTDTGMPSRGEDGKDGVPGKDAPQEAVLYTPQELTDEQKAQVWENIGLDNLPYVGSGSEWELLTEVETTEEVSEIIVDVPAVPEDAQRYGYRFFIYISCPSTSYKEHFQLRPGNDIAILSGAATSNIHNDAYYIAELHGRGSYMFGWYSKFAAGVETGLYQTGKVNKSFTYRYRLITDGGNPFPVGTKMRIERYIREDAV